MQIILLASMHISIRMHTIKYGGVRNRQLRRKFGLHTCKLLSTFGFVSSATQIHPARDLILALKKPKPLVMALAAPDADSVSAVSSFSFA